MVATPARQVRAAPARSYHRRMRRLMCVMALIAVVVAVLAGGMAPVRAAGAQATRAEPLRVHLQRIARRLRRAMIVLGLGQHFLDIDDAALPVEKGDGQRQQRVLHPHAVTGIGIENEQHAAMRWHRLAHHQAAHAAFLGIHDFRLDAMHAGRQFDDRQFRRSESQ